MDADAALAVIAKNTAVTDELVTLDVDALTHAQLLHVLHDLEVTERRRAALSHRILARLDREANPMALGAKSLRELLADRLKISATDAARRVDHARDLGPRVSLLGASQEPVLARVAAIHAAGRIGVDHVVEIRRFFATLPGWVDLEERDLCEQTLASIAPGLTPEGLREAAKRLRTTIDPDGSAPNDAERARRRYLAFGRQDPDGTVAVHGRLDPQTAAALEAINAKLAAPGMCNPDDEHPCTTGTPTQEQIDGDGRTQGQRNQDALSVIARNALADGRLGQHHGLPVTIIVTTTLQDLQAAAGLPETPAPARPALPARPAQTAQTAVTAGGSLIPMSEVIRMASHAYHYLTVFDRHTNEILYCGRTKRIAPPAHRIVLYARDRGCTKPGCRVPAYGTQVHHTNGWVRNHGQTNVDEEVLACPGDNRLAEYGWTVTITPEGVQWIPPPDLDTGAPRINDYHHPERLFRHEG